MITLEGDTRLNVLWLVLFSNVIFLWELAVSLMPLGLAAFIYFNLYRKRKYVKPSADILKNMRFIQLAMGHFSDVVHLIYSFIEDYVFWGQPDRTHEILREILKLPVPIAITLYFLPLRMFLILGMWLATMSHSPFCMSIFRILKDKGTHAYKDLMIGLTFRGFLIGIKNWVLSCFSFENYPFKELIKGLTSYCRKQKRSIVRYESAPDLSVGKDELLKVIKEETKEQPVSEASKRSPVMQLDPTTIRNQLIKGNELFFNSMKEFQRDDKALSEQGETNLTFISDTNPLNQSVDNAMLGKQAPDLPMQTEEEKYEHDEDDAF